MNNFTAVANGPAVLTVRFNGVKAGWEQWILLSADRHHDNIYCNRQLEHYHLTQVIERDALVLDFGDCFCSMQGKWDPRSSMDDIRPEDVGADYLDRIVRHAAEFYGPFAARWLLMGKGNHESSILNRHGVDLTSNLVHRLNSDYGGQVYVGGYGGWVRFQFEDDSGRIRATKHIKYHHGSGGEAPVTKGVIQTNRQAVFLPDADVVVNGHNHNSYVLPIARERLTTRGIVDRDIIWFCRTPGYKDEYADGSKGWAIEKGMSPKPLGAIWMRVFADRHTSFGRQANRKGINVNIELIQAVT